ncbi:somatostatin receptor type 2-like [Scleropages formosus]|uniref:Somatostatin receptor type 2-like n=1 Tax=Scleropages formosus TaxID=113540 RepID=A0A0P7YKV3_SCLFO|nr:somatostatin receptor type 2-like [Scleropages formosus]
MDVGLGGNALVMTAMLKLDQMSTATTVYIFNLALADGLFMVGLPFIAYQNLQNHWPFGNLACRLVMVLDGVNQFTSVFCLTVMSVDRCLAAASPLHFGQWRSPRRAKVVTLLLWPLSLLPILPMAIHFSADSGHCILDPHGVFDTWWPVFITYTFILGFALPFSIMITSFVVLVVTLRACRQGSPQSHERQRLEGQVTKMVAAVALAFAICWLPFYATNFYAQHSPDLEPAFSRAFQFVVLLSYSWSCANPILYACFSEVFRKHFHTLLCRKWHGPPHFDTNTEIFSLHDAESSMV